jgi:molybdopterin synthase sulfur carrier subunit
MKVSIRYFASIREALGRGGEAIETGARSAGALRDELIARGGAYAQALARGKAVRIAVGQVMAGDDAPIEEGAEVAFFPPVTGG